jgi:hypothetical protein
MDSASNTVGNSASPLTGDQTASPSKARLWTGRVLSAIPALFLLSGGVTAWLRTQQVIDGTAQLGYPTSLLPVLGTIELICIVLYLIPRTAIFGALLLTAYFGGAVASHVRIADPRWIGPVIFGVLVWAGLILRKPRVGSLLFQPIAD